MHALFGYNKEVESHTYTDGSSVNLDCISVLRCIIDSKTEDFIATSWINKLGDKLERDVNILFNSLPQVENTVLPDSTVGDMNDSQPSKKISGGCDEEGILEISADGALSNNTPALDEDILEISALGAMRSDIPASDEDVLEISAVDAIPSNILVSEEKVFMEIKDFLSARKSSRESRPWCKMIGGVETKSDIYHFDAHNSVNPTSKKISLIRIDETLKLYHWTLKSVVSHRNMKQSVR